MELENQGCTLEQAKELAGLLGDNAPRSLWDYKYEPRRKTWWIRPSSQFPFPIEPLSFKGIICVYTKQFPAYSCAELGVLLPRQLGSKLGLIFLYSPEHWPKKIAFAYGNNRSPYEYIEIGGSLSGREHEAHAKADLLIHLLKEKIIKPEGLKL